MATVAATPVRAGMRIRALVGSRWAPAAGLVLLSAVSVLLRTQRFGVGFWIDEALSVGIADRPLADIPGVLRQDGSPPLYYLLLNVWMRVLGDRSEEATHALSLVFAVAAIPVAFLLMRALFGERAGWAAAVLAALNPFLTQYAQETRMYTLVVLLGIVCCACFAGAFVLDRGRGWTIGFAASLTALLYTHNWALLLGAACALAWLPTRRFRRGLLAFGAVAGAYLPWLPSLLFQAAHTGAPWARVPDLSMLLRVPGQLLGESPLALFALAAAIAVGVRVPPPRRWTAEARAGLAFTAIGLGTLVLAWLVSQSAPAWALRYLATALAPLLLAAALATARAGSAGLVVLAVVAAIYANGNGPAAKSNVRAVSSQIESALGPGDLVISTQPEQAPALAYYLGEIDGLRWATLTGPLTDLGVTDWRDGVERLEAATAERDLAPLLDGVAPGGKVALIVPEIVDLQRWDAPWTALVRVKSTEWAAWMYNDGRFRVVAVRPMSFSRPHPNPVRAIVFRRERVR